MGSSEPFSVRGRADRGGGGPRQQMGHRGVVTLLNVWASDGVPGRGGAALRAGAQAAGRPVAPVIWSQMVKRMIISAR